MSEFLLSSLAFPIPLDKHKSKALVLISKTAWNKGFLPRDQQPGSSLHWSSGCGRRHARGRTATPRPVGRGSGVGVFGASGAGARERPGAPEKNSENLRPPGFPEDNFLKRELVRPQVSCPRSFREAAVTRRGAGAHKRHRREEGRTLPLTAPSAPSSCSFLEGGAPGLPQGLGTECSREGIRVLAEETQTRRAGPPVERWWGPFPPAATAPALGGGT